MLNYKRYQRVPVLDYPEREWPNKEIRKAPIWCSVDLRDGNQALIEPMVVSEKLEMFKMLVKLGFKEIEVGFPSASQLEYDFLRRLVDENLIPDDVTVQVLVQCREHLLRRTFEAIHGLPKAIVHIYNSTSVLQRDVVFGKSRDEITKIAVEGAQMVKDMSGEFPGMLRMEYSPESFTGTEMDYALEICTAVQEVWQPTRENKLIINLPSTVEVNTPNVYADQIEWMSRHFKDRDTITLSIHPHNDRGTGVAAAELALLAGADRVEGTLFGNGERTGNLDITTVAYNMFSQGINPELNLEDVRSIAEVYERVTRMKIHERHPYAGKLVFTAFSGSHQDAINKGMRAMRERNNPYWEVPYLPIDPTDIGREYEPVVRINSQSGKGGVAFIMDSEFGFKMPKGMHREFADVIQKIAEDKGEVAPQEIYQVFEREYLTPEGPLELLHYEMTDIGRDTRAVVDFRYNGEEMHAECMGNGPIDAVKTALLNVLPVHCRILDYTEHALTQGSNSKAAAYLHMVDLDTGKTTYGVGTSSNITRASIRGLFSAMNRLFR